MSRVIFGPGVGFIARLGESGNPIPSEVTPEGLLKPGFLVVEVMGGEVQFAPAPPDAVPVNSKTNFPEGSPDDD